MKLQKNLKWFRALLFACTTLSAPSWAEFSPIINNTLVENAKSLGSIDLPSKMRSFPAQKSENALKIALTSSDKQVASPAVPALPANTTFLKANEVTFKESENTVAAHGNVEIIQTGKVIRADSIFFTPKKATKNDHVHAKGQVFLKEATGEIFFAEEAEFENNFQQGFVKEIKGILIDNSKIAARTGQRCNEDKMIFNHGVYSPCYVDANTTPLWQLKADKIIEDKAEEVVRYHHARMEIWGMPMAYLPYFHHPHPSVKRKTGILTPSYGSSSDLGTLLILPLYWAISPDKDLTITPIFTSKEGTILTGEYRQLFNGAKLITSASFTQSHNLHGATYSTSSSDARNNPRHKRWHFFMFTEAYLNEEHLLTVDINRASDLTYVSRYPVLPGGQVMQTRQAVLTSYAAIEQFKNTSYGVVKGYVFQSYTPKTAPTVLPKIFWTYESLPGYWDEVWQLDVNMLNIQRIVPVVGQGAHKMLRGSVGGGTQIPMVTRYGDIWCLKLYGRSDLYHTEDYRQRVDIQTGKASVMRLFPQASLGWRYPFVKYFKTSQWVLEPAAMVVGSSQGGNRINIPNEDSLITTLDSSSLFLPNRFYGIDRVDSGYRFVYGLNSKNYFSKGKHFFLFAGQTLRLDNKQVLTLLNGEDHKKSDYVVSSEIVPYQGIIWTYRTQLDRKNFGTKLVESQANINYKWVTTSATYLYVNKGLTTTGKKTSQLNLGLSTKINKWSFGINEIRDFAQKKRKILARGVSAIYQNECLRVTFTAARTYYQDRDLKPSKTFLIQLDFKNLGGISPLRMLGISPFSQEGGVQSTKS